MWKVEEGFLRSSQTQDIKIDSCGLLCEVLHQWIAQWQVGPVSVHCDGVECIFSRQASLARQAFLITPLHGARYKTGKNAYAKK